MESIQNLRILSQIFSPSMFEKIIRGQDTLSFIKKINKHFQSQKINHTNLEIIKVVYKALQKDYRCEYIYKNNLLLDIIKRYRLDNTLTLNELKIGSSKADLVMLNGVIRIFEIKTELDGFSKLSKQISDYQKFADSVYIVTDEKYAQKLKIEYANTSIGIIVLNKNNVLIEEKKASNNDENLDFETIFKVLRKQEYLDLVKSEFGFIPNVPNTKIFKVCYEMLYKKMSVKQFQEKVLLILKKRKLHSPNLLISKKTPKELRYICNSLNLKEKEYEYLYSFLAQNNSLCINHI